MILPPNLDRLLRGLPELRRALVVGGSVRDWLLEQPVKDFDVEVFGVSEERLLSALSRIGRVDCVGRSFGVFKLTVAPGETYDFSLPRRDSKTAPGHQGFEVRVDANLNPAEAAARRDFTINSMMWDPHNRRLLDPHGGVGDLRAGILRHTSPAFPEDPLRVLRGMQFAGRFNLAATSETLALCRTIASSFYELPPERIREEWFKWAIKSRVPSAGLQFLAGSGWLVHFPELEAIQGVPQDPEWHPEGDVWRHTLHCMDALVSLEEWQVASEERRLVWAFALLLHDTGKAGHTREEWRGDRIRITAPGHEIASVGLADRWMVRMGVPRHLADRVLPLIANHMIHRTDVSPRSVRRLALRLAPATIPDLTVVLTADVFGRPPRPRILPPVVPLLLTEADRQALLEGGPKPLIQGRHLVDLGWRPGPAFGPLLARAFEAQLDGAFSDESGAQRWLREQPEMEP